MRVHRSLIALTTLTTLATFAACAPYGGRGESSAEVSIRWDSGPLDRSYARERDIMVVRHNQEIANPRSDESSDQRTRRHTAENKDLDDRYARGKASHSDRLPDSDK
jgi:hypothetical protein